MKDNSIKEDTPFWPLAKPPLYQKSHPPEINLND